MWWAGLCPQVPLEWMHPSRLVAPTLHPCQCPLNPLSGRALAGVGIPYVVSVGALDMVNFGNVDSVPEKFKERQLYVHNEQVTLMRTTVEENKEFGMFIAKKLKQATVPTYLLLPEKSVSLLDAEGQSFSNESARAALYSTLTTELQDSKLVTVEKHPYDINDPEFSQALANAYRKACEQNPGKGTLVAKSLGTTAPDDYKLACPDYPAGQEESPRSRLLPALHKMACDGEIPIIGAGAGIPCGTIADS